MKRKLLRQICNEWTANVWLCVELLIVSVVMWYITDLFYTSWSTYHEPRGFATDHCYLIKHSTLSPKSAEYKPYEGNGPMRDDFIKLFEALQSRPEVEAVAAGFASYFYNGSNAYLKVQNDSLGFKKGIHVRTVSQDFPIVFDIHGINGETPQQRS